MTLGLYKRPSSGEIAATLLQQQAGIRVILIDALVCIHCDGPRRLLTFVSDHLADHHHHAEPAAARA